MEHKYLDSISIKGFKSIRELNSFKLNKINVFIGPNGSGKSNFIEAFKVINAISKCRL